MNLIPIEAVSKLTGIPAKGINVKCTQKQFPLPVKDKEGNIVWHKEEVETFLSSKAP